MPSSSREKGNIRFSVRNKANIKSFVSRLAFSLIAIISPKVLAEMRLNLNDGLKFYNGDDQHYWFKMNTHCKFDYTQLSRHSDPATLRKASGTVGYIRNAELSLSGGLGKNFSYSIRFDFTLTQKIMFAFLKYSGLGKNTSVLFGQIWVPYGFENASSSRWGSFLEKSLPSGAFGSHSGIGLNVHHSWESVTASLAFTQHAIRPSTSKQYKADPFQQAMRITFSPVHSSTEVYHFGISARHFALKPDTFVLTARSEARGPLSDFLLKSPKINARNAYVWGSEVAYLQGPWTLQGEYMATHLQRLNGVPKNVRFHGGYGQVSYILTGESRKYNFKMGAFGRIQPQSSAGAWEIGFRQSYIKLSNRGLPGARKYSRGVSIGWTMNNHVRILGNYIRAHIQKPLGRKQKVDIIGMRVQFVY